MKEKELTKMNQNDKVIHTLRGACVYVYMGQGILKLLISSPIIFLEDPLALWAQSFKNDPS